MPQKKTANLIFKTFTKHVMKSKLLAIIISIMLLTGMIPISVYAYEDPYSGTCSDGIAWSLDSDGTLTIGLQDGYDIGSIQEAPWLEFVNSINRIVIEDGVEGIYSTGAFSGCPTLTEVELPDSLCYIGDHAFTNCMSLSIINFPAEVESIGERAFEGCESLEEVVLPPLIGTGYIGENIFCNSGLKHAILEDGMEAIPANLFKDAENLTSVTIPDTVENIGDYAFYGCTSLEEITLPPLIGTGSIGSDVFVNSGLKSAILADDMEAIPANLFKDVDTLTSVTIPDTIENIGDYAFYGCTSLEEITLPPLIGTGSIGSDVFVNSGLKSAILADGMEAIPANLFRDVDTLTSVTIPDTVENIGDYAFYGCTSLEEITLPPLVGTGSIGSDVFVDSGLKSAVLADEMEAIPAYLFSGVNTLESVTIPSSVTSIKSNAFYDCTDLTNVTLPDGLTEIEGYAFYNCSSLTQITIPAGVESAGYAFEESGLTTATLEDGLTEIPDAIFANANNLTTVNIPSSVSYIGSYAFSNTSLTDVFYSGYGSEWYDISVSYGNDPLSDATKHFNEGLIPDIEDSQIDLDQTVIFSANGEHSQYYTFAPSESGYYRITSEGGYNEESSFYSSMGITVYDDQFSECTDYTYYNSGNGFRYETWFEKGRTYIIKVQQYESGFAGECSVVLTQILSTEDAQYYGNDAGSALYWSLSGGTLTIAGSDEMNDFSSASKAPWYKYKDSITKLVVDEDVTTIGTRAFSSYTNLISAELPDSLSVIGNNAFYNSGLTSVQYGGSKEDWNSIITVGSNNKPLANASFTYLKYDVFISDDIQNGWIYVKSSDSRCSAKPGETVTIEAVLDVYNHYTEVDSLICSTMGGSLAVPVDSLEGDPERPDLRYYSFIMPEEDVTITAIFKLETFPVTISSDEGCDITITADDPEYPNERIAINDGDQVEYGTTLYITVTPKTGFSLVDDPSYGYTDWTETVESDMEFIATSKLNDYQLYVYAEGDGYTAPSVSGSNFTLHESYDDYCYGTVRYGTLVSVTAGDPEDGCEFIGWYQNNGKLLTTEKEYTFTMGAETTYLYAHYLQKSGIVTFMANNLEIETFEFDGENFITENDFPSEPSALYGFEFDCWDKTVSEINAALEQGENITVTAQFKPASVNFTITIYNGEKETPTVKTYTENKWITVRAEEVPGKKFAYWMMNDQILNYNANASFRSSEDCTITAVYTTEDVDTQGTALIKSAKYNNGSLVFVSYLTVPDGATITRAGLLAASPTVNSSKYTVGDELTFANADYIKNSAKSVGTSGPVTYTWTKTNVSVNDAWFARPYVIYTLNGEETTVYGNMVTVNAGDDYDSSEMATAIIRSSSYDGSSAKFVAYLTVPDGSTIEKAGVVAAPEYYYDPTDTVLTWDNAQYKKVSQKAIGTSGPVTYTWTKTNAGDGGTWYVRPYVIYKDTSGKQHTVYGLMTTLETES